MSTNQGPEYFAAEKQYLNSTTLADKIHWLEEMMRGFKKHKGSEKMLADLRTRLNKLIEKVEKNKKVGKGKKGIRKEGFQFVIIGNANVGKSLLLSRLTNAEARVSDYPFSTIEPAIGTLDYKGVRAQVIDVPSIGSEYFDIGIINNTDGLIIVVENFSELAEIEKILFKAIGKEIIVVNKIDLLDAEGFRKLEATMKSRKINGILVSALTGEGIEELKERMRIEMGVIRIFMKEPGRPKSEQPMILKEGATVRNVAEGILKGFSKTVAEVRLSGPSSKFPNQKIGLDHVLKDLDVVEFHTR